MENRNIHRTWLTPTVEVCLTRHPKQGILTLQTVNHEKDGGGHFIGKGVYRNRGEALEDMNAYIKQAGDLIERPFYKFI